MEKNSELLGEFRGRFYKITRRVSPSFQEIESFSVSVHYTDPDSHEEVEVVRIDSSHGEVHMDQLFSEGRPKKAMTGYDAFSAYSYLKANWQEFAAKFEDSQSQ